MADEAVEEEFPNEIIFEVRAGLAVKKRRYLLKVWLICTENTLIQKAGHFQPSMNQKVRWEATRKPLLR